MDGKGWLMKMLIFSYKSGKIWHRHKLPSSAGSNVLLDQPQMAVLSWATQAAPVHQVLRFP